MKTSLLLMLILVWFIMACAVETVPTTTPSMSPTTEALADLVVEGRTNTYPAGGCVEGLILLGTDVYVSNLGPHAITTTFVIEYDGSQQIVVNSLAVNERKFLFFEGNPKKGWIHLVVDPDNRIPETNETNNSYEGQVMSLTPAYRCPPTATLQGN